MVRVPQQFPHKPARQVHDSDRVAEPRMFRAVIHVRSQAQLADTSETLEYRLVDNLGFPIEYPDIAVNRVSECAGGLWQRHVPAIL